jgi:protein SCO1/2
MVRRKPGVRIAVPLLAAAGMLASYVHGAEQAAPHDMAAMANMPGMAGMDHTAHLHALANTQLKRAVVSYAVPDLKMMRSDGAGVSLDTELNDGRPIVMNFIYTTCTTICPLSSLTFSQLQTRLGADSARVHLVSISIDPEQDTPARLTEYARQFHAGKEWQYYTGTLQASVAAQRAFGVYRGDKMNHTPVTLVRPSPGSDWVRLDGFATADDLYAELKEASVLD